MLHMKNRMKASLLSCLVLFLVVGFTMMPVEANAYSISPTNDVFVKKAVSKNKTTGSTAVSTKTFKSGNGTATVKMTCYYSRAKQNGPANLSKVVVNYSKTKNSTPYFVSFFADPKKGAVKYYKFGDKSLKNSGTITWNVKVTGINNVMLYVMNDYLSAANGSGTRYVFATQFQ